MNTVMMAGKSQLEAMRQVIGNSRKWAHPLNIHKLFADGFKFKATRKGAYNGKTKQL